ncbi:MAG: class I SAM-dependent methyltransferase [Deltaproteobacteria bacterium]|nr:class I SAM-dependent methyltransferase [Deltaproteobacteria bacterium]
MAEQASASPLALPGTWDVVVDGYTSELAPLFETFASAALEVAGLEDKSADVADVACGPGTLALLAAERGHRVKALDFAPAMIERLKLEARKRQVDVDGVVGDGLALPWADSSFDAAFSMFGLIFFADRDRGFRELLRVLRPGGTAVVSSWVPIARLEVMGGVFAILGELLKGPAPPTVLADRESCIQEMSAAGFVDVVVEERSVIAAHASADAMLQSFERSAAPLVLLKKQLGERWGDVRADWLLKVIERFGAGPQEVEMIALLTAGQKS